MHETHSPSAQDQANTNNLAVASLILGILSITGIGALTGIPAIVTGALSLKNPASKGMGIAGLVMGIVATVITILFVLFVILLIIIGLATTPTYDEYYQQAPSDSFDTSESYKI